MIIIRAFLILVSFAMAALGFLFGISQLAVILGLTAFVVFLGIKIVKGVFRFIFG